MPIAKAVQNGDIVELFDQDGNKILEEKGVFYELVGSTVRIKIGDNKLKAIWQEGNKFRYDFETIVNVEFEYKGVTIKGFSIFSVKNYFGATMTSPVNGIKTSDSYHIPGHAHWGNHESGIKIKTVESLKKAYDEYLELINNKGS